MDTMKTDIRFYNSLSRKLETFEPITPGLVLLYVCGPTVYSDPHIGNMRPAVVFDTLRRYLEFLGYEVRFVSNLTDVDDKIIARAKKENVTEAVIAERYIKAYRELLASLAIRPYYMEPRVTDFIPEIISYISDLIAKKAAYVVDGDVYFRVRSVPTYGILNNFSVDDLLVGARVERNEQKESPSDFVLWKKTSEGLNWLSPWGRGRPGWHTECCVMVEAIFGGLIDIHGGGSDLRFPHHENEIAQAMAHDGHSLAHYWLHNGLLNLEGGKMSKSLGNVILAKDFITEHGGNLFRLLLLSTHYRSPLTVSEKTISSTKIELARIADVFHRLAIKLQLLRARPFTEELAIEPFLDAMADDLNTANALTVLFTFLKSANAHLRLEPVDPKLLAKDFASLCAMLAILGIEFTCPRLSEDDLKLHEEYLACRARKDYTASDRIRAILVKKGIL